MIADQYWQIFENIGLSMIDSDLKVLMVTSPGRGEGKSVTAANLAAIAAENGRRVLIIDADVRQPIQHKIFHLKNGSGWAAIVKNLDQLEESAQPTMIANLSVLTSGRPIAYPVRWLASAAVKNLVRKAAELFDLVIIDAPDVLSGKEAPLIAELCDAILLIAKSAGPANQHW
ncbi:CpsD/CapB family tyrosine-protein kinase [Terrilactibacillus sp. S3-3]|nr:CpsD/CapB family tyrosine-protein kinase [Terrilactibacillus sp. S3-3]